MRRNFFRGFLLCLIPTALAGLFTVMAFNKELAGQVGFRRGIDLAGGTILVYEIDVEGMKRKIAADNEANKSKVDFRERRYEDEQPDMRELAEKIKKRIDPSDLKNVVVRPVGEARIEIILPYSGSATDGNKVAGNEEFAEEVRQQVKQAGVLEFRILANETDDRPGIDRAMETLGGMRVDSTREQVSVTQERVAGPTPAEADDLAARARDGRPPAGPVGTFPVKIGATGEEVQVRYEWLELGPEERDSLHLSTRYAAAGTAPPPKRGDSTDGLMFRYKAVAAAVLRGDFRDWPLDAVFDLIVHGFGHTSRREGRDRRVGIRCR